MITWIKNHKLAVVLLIILIIIVIGNNRKNNSSTSTISRQVVPMTGGGMGGLSESSISKPSMFNISNKSVSTYDSSAPQPEIKNRLVISNSYLSLLVKNVVETRKKIITYAESLGGYMVNAEVNNPQDAPTATITVRIPSKQMEEAMEYLRGLSVKVVSENLHGIDVTDQYVDIEKNIEILEETKAKFEEILNGAREITDITQLNREIISIQSQIDSYKGQKLSLEKNAEMAKITIYMSTDEIALPYAPSETFRPSVIFKQAVRSLVADLRHLAGTLIWIAVYIPVWVPILVVLFFSYKLYRKIKGI